MIRVVLVAGPTRQKRNLPLAADHGFIPNLTNSWDIARNQI